MYHNDRPTSLVGDYYILVCITMIDRLRLLGCYCIFVCIIMIDRLRILGGFLYIRVYHNDRSTSLIGRSFKVIRMYSPLQIHSDFVHMMILPLSPVSHKAGNHPSSRASFARCTARERQEGTGRPCLSEFEVIAYSMIFQEYAKHSGRL